MFVCFNVFRVHYLLADQPCQDLFPYTAVSATLAAAANKTARVRRWSTTLVEGPQSSTCYFVPQAIQSLTNAEFGTTWENLLGTDYETAQAQFCRPLNATLVRSLSFGQQFYSRYLLPLAWRDFGVSVPHWTDAMAQVTDPGDGLPVRELWQWSDGRNLTGDTIWVGNLTGDSNWAGPPLQRPGAPLALAEGQAAPPNITCATEKSFGHISGSEFAATSVPWQRFTCRGTALPICQRTLARSVAALDFTPRVILKVLASRMDSVANQLLAAEPVRDLIVAECTVDRGALLNANSIAFFVPFFKTLVEPINAALYMVRDGKHSGGDPVGSLLSVDCFFGGSLVECPQRDSSPGPDTSMMRGWNWNWNEMLQLSGYYHCAVLLRETLQWVSLYIFDDQ